MTRVPPAPAADSGTPSASWVLQKGESGCEIPSLKPGNPLKPGGRRRAGGVRCGPATGRIAAWGGPQRAPEALGSLAHSGQNFQKHPAPGGAIYSGLASWGSTASMNLCGDQELCRAPGARMSPDAEPKRLKSC